MKVSSLKKNIKLDEWISQAEAARIRGISPPAMYDLVRRKRVKTLEIAGKVLVNRTEIEAFVPRVGGRPRKTAVDKRDAGATSK